MASSIKVKDSTKIELEKLQARLLLEYNKKLNQQEIIDILVSLGKKNPILLIKKANTINKSIFKKMEKRISSWKLPTDPNVIDDILYGEN